MGKRQPEPDPRAADLVGAFLARRENGEPADFEALCGAHPELADELRAVLAAAERVLAALKSGSGAKAGLSADLARRFGPGVDPQISLEPSSATADADPGGDLLKRLREHRTMGRRYRLLGEVGRGGMGAVFKVWDTDLRRPLAMKVVLGRDAEPSGETPPVDPRTLGRFLEEAQVTGQLDHPGIVPVHELGLDSEGRVYFTMRLVRGRELKAIFGLVESGAEGWTLSRAVGVLLRVCEAMAFAHDKGVVHRDLKPSNVMVGRFGEVYVMDWGLARVIGREDAKDVRLAGSPLSTTEVVTARSELAPEGDSPLLTIDGDVIGTPAFMSPEQARGELRDVGPRSDVYSVGAMLYQLLTGEMPYVRQGTAPSPHAVWRSVLAGPPAPVESLRSGVPPELAAICEKAMAREPAERHPSMLALAEELRAFLENRVVRSYRTGALVEARKWVVRNRLAAAVLAALLLVLVASGFTSSWLEGRRRAAVQRSLEQQTASALVRDAERLDAPDPGRVPEMREWLSRARAVAPRLPDYEKELTAFELAHADATRVEDPDAAARLPDEFERKRFEEQLRVYREVVDGDRARRAQLEALSARKPEEDAELAGLRWDLAVLERELADIPGRIAEFDARRAAVRTWHYADAQVEEAYAPIAATVSDLRSLAEPDGGRIAELERRLELASTLSARSIDAHRAEWDAARASIADRGQCPPYDGLQLGPQPGLVPLRRDPLSGLWEFWHVLSGDRPELGTDGQWRIEPETGIVLVLVPGGTQVLGSQSDDPSAPNYVDETTFARLLVGERAGLRAGRNVRVVAQLQPYFLSKYELTQAQWLRLTGTRPSTRFAGSGYAGQRYISRTHPVESVDWFACEEALRRFGLRLPTEVQWEHAARAGTSSPYWSGTDGASLVGHANGAAAYTEPADADTFAYHAPVGSFGVNPWGFADMSGNVWEWCADWYNTYEHVASVGEADGLLSPDYSVLKCVRGGGFTSPLAELRAGLRYGRSPASRDEDLGVRPSRAIQD